MALSVLVDSGALASNPFTLPRSRPFVIDVPSQAATALFCDFATASGGPVFDRLARTDGTGAPYCVHSGSGNAWDVVLTPPTPWGRLAVSSGPSSPMSYAVLEAR